jgi:glycosyltransferase involved in cell wall biosynthesis
MDRFGSHEVNGFLPSSVDIIVLLDCFWANPLGRLAAFLDECQCDKFLMIYDLIPLTVPGEPADAKAFEVSLEVLEARVDGFLAISNFTRIMVERYLFQKSISRVCKSVPLAQQKPSEFEVFLGNSRTSLADKFLIADLLGKPFILSVSSVSARKRILETAEAFLDTLEENHEWLLVIVGQDPGHDRKLSDTLLEVCRKSAGRIIWLKNVGDRDLDRLYQNCEYVAYLSRIEGWGLPIGEALAYGKLPLAHRESSIPEVGGDFAMYCDVDRRSVATALFQIMQNEPLRKRLTGRELQNSLRTWHDVASDFLNSVGFEACGPKK